MTLYKYLPAQYGMEALQNGRVKVSRLNELNDIFDCKPIITGEGDFFKRDPEAAREKFREKFNEEFGLISYSETPTDEQLWAHYADKGTGMALGFEFNSGIYLNYNFTEGNHQPHLRCVVPMRYNDTQVTLNMSEIWARAREQDNPPALLALLEGSITKGLSWRHEREQREFLDLRGCIPVGLHYFMEFHCSQLTEIILGPKCVVSAKQVIHSLTTAGRWVSSFVVKRALPTSGEFRYEIREEARHVVE